MYTNSITLIYAIFPTDLWQVVNDLQNPKAQEYFQEIGATIEIPEATHEVLICNYNYSYLSLNVSCKHSKHSLAKHSVVSYKRLTKIIHPIYLKF